MSMSIMRQSFLLVLMLVSSSLAYSQSPRATYGPTIATDTLWSVATAVRPNETVTTQQVQWALFNENPKAFGSKRDPGNLLKGITLRVPPLDKINVISTQEALQNLSHAAKIAKGKPITQVSVIKPAQPVIKKMIPAEKKIPSAPSAPVAEQAVLARVVKKTKILIELDPPSFTEISQQKKATVVAKQEQPVKLQQLPAPVEKNDLVPKVKPAEVLQPTINEQALQQLQQEVAASSAAAAKLEHVDLMFAKPLAGFDEELQAVVNEFTTTEDTVFMKIK